jgi:dephospho-CoA kinase
MLSVALTGNIGAGKSSVARLFQRWGATIIDADQLVREAQAPGQPLLIQLAQCFGSKLILPDGSLDRGALRARILADPQARADLNRMVHPVVHRRRLELLAQARARGDRIVVSDIPLLFEAADPSEFDAVVLVHASESVRQARLLASRALSPAEVDLLMAAQLPSAPKRARSDHIIENEGDLDALEREAAAVWQALLARA